MSPPQPPETMPALNPASAAERRRWVTPEPLNVAPALVGLPLASPWRRAMAMGLDLLVLALVAESGDLWLFVGLLLVVLQLYRRRQAQAGDPGAGERQNERKRLGWLLAALLVGLAASQAWSLWRSPDSQRAVAEERADVEAERAAEAGSPPASASRASETEAEAEAAGGAGAANALAEELAEAQARIAKLEARLEAARKAQPKTVRQQAEDLFEAVASRFGWGIVYFSLLPAWWAGQTLGKRVLGLRVLQLTGQPVTVMTSLKRYGGYAAGLATGGLGFAQVLWDPNRQGLQDKAAHTVVVDLRAPSFTPAAAPPQDPAA